MQRFITSPTVRAHLSSVPPLATPPAAAVTTIRRIREKRPDMPSEHAVFLAAWIHGLTGTQTEILRKLVTLTPATEVVQ